jgi:hypothetical protein
MNRNDPERVPSDLLRRDARDLARELSMLRDRAGQLERHGYFDLADTMWEEARRVSRALALRLEEEE